MQSTGVSLCHSHCPTFDIMICCPQGFLTMFTLIFTFLEPVTLNLCSFSLILKTELESLPLSSIVGTKAVLDSCTYDSVLTITVQERYKRTPQVFMFQCEETGVSNISPESLTLILTASREGLHTLT